MTDSVGTLMNGVVEDMEDFEQVKEERELTREEDEELFGNG
jgi:hypothetical protein